MIIKYRGFELEAKREKSMAGYDMVYVSAFRISDGWEFIADAYDGNISVREAIRELKNAVDKYYENPDGYEDGEYE
jgi:hypothetical protein